MSSEFKLSRGIGAPSKCRTCKAPIVFAIMTSGKTAPFERDPNGKYILENGNALLYLEPSTQLELGAAPPAQPERWTSHFANCPNADEHRRDRRGGE